MKQINMSTTQIQLQTLVLAQGQTEGVILPGKATRVNVRSY